ncbi:bifunctional DNA-formamidopyrimidine glycosylase/DNA-(apurinic or apyrimidinic site) lyase [Thermanaeromonas sp. C210]|uniref:bifunctional DNA-formamidopyrimidine glycosylase/DNA-(apurinic or apyrimidinic site) lyase n=1 Tax=Thermanaeromonas sp. C210 TaxID=2731925 RepID=UPI00155B83AB|nr:bifunctional DNA-formamidopyrimidine glycosylase/DNA-(apurinic or apyrimidinic site) lyase [Thermanaeromonas sp. C210]GFN22455.1 formamidopyrimidine-DNA glycosylase [Thermanaeromonas sp. C210]
MPELPEVETIKRTLKPKVEGRVIEGVEVLNPAVVCSPSPEEFCSLLPEKRILDIGRRGKYLLWQVDGGHALVWHLGMTGRLTVSSPGVPLEPHTHVLLTLDGGLQVRYADPRRFGRCYLGPVPGVFTLAGLDRLGVEPLSPEFTPEGLKGLLAGRRRCVKEVLLDQHCLAGLGNIYCDEALFEAGIHPLRPSCTLTVGEVARLHRAIRKVLEDGICHGGTSIRDYIDGDGKRGCHQEYLAVYGRAGQPCPRCGGPVERLVVGGRGTHFCRRCQG